jgi:hypothetical protein
MATEEPTKAEFARSLGISAPAISKAIKAGNIILTASGRVNTQDPRTQKYMTRNPGERRAAKRERKKAEAATVTTPPHDTKMPAAGTIGGDNLRGKTGDDEEDLDSLDAAFLREKIEEKQIANAAKRGELIPRTIVAQFIQRIYSADTTELDQIADRLGGKLAGAARNATTESEAAAAVRSLLTDEATRIKRHIHRIQTDFVKKYHEPPEPELAGAVV